MPHCSQVSSLGSTQVMPMSAQTLLSDGTGRGIIQDCLSATRNCIGGTDVTLAANQVHKMAAVGGVFCFAISGFGA